MLQKNIDIHGTILPGYECRLGEKKLIFIVAPKGYVMCGYLNRETAERFNDCACVVTGVSSLEQMLSAPVAWVSAAACEKDIHIGMKVSDALEKLL
jgi:uncharacterized protein YunC (DUF1805 family)